MKGNSSEFRVIACNMVQATAYCTRGALVYVTQVTQGRLKVLVRSRGLRWVQVWVPIGSLANFRFKTIPPQHTLHSRLNNIASPQFFGDDNLAAISALGAGQGLDLRTGR